MFHLMSLHTVTLPYNHCLLLLIPIHIQQLNQELHHLLHRHMFHLMSLHTVTLPYNHCLLLLIPIHIQQLNQELHHLVHRHISHLIYLHMASSYLLLKHYLPLTPSALSIPRRIRRSNQMI